MTIGEIRSQIDTIDDQIAKLLTNRLILVKGLSRYKIANDLPVLDPEREFAVLERIEADIPAEYAVYVRNIFAGIMAQSRSMQDRMLKEAGK